MFSKTVFAHQISEIAHYVLLNNVGKFLLTEKSKVCIILLKSWLINDYCYWDIRFVINSLGL